MRIIAHRGKMHPDDEVENEPTQISSLLSEGIEVEVDARLIGDSIYLGHDSPDYKVHLWFLEQEGIWCHVKNFELLEFLNRSDNSVHYFWHNEDDYALTSDGYIWVYPGKTLLKDSVCVKPELGFEGDIHNCHAVCTADQSLYNRAMRDTPYRRSFK